MAQNEWWKQGATAVETQATSADADWWKKGATPVDAPTKASPLRKLGDFGLSVAKGVVGIPEAIVGALDIPTSIATGGEFSIGKTLENEGGTFGLRTKQAKDYLTSLQSQDLADKRQEFADADGILAKTGVALSNPSLIANTVAESVPSMLGGAALARGAGMAVPALAGRIGLTAAGEGIVGAGSMAESVRQQTEDGLLTPTQAAITAGAGLATAGLGVVGNKAAKALGVGDIDQMIASGAIKGSARQGLGIANRGARGALTEGVFEELPQSLAETGLQNIALDRPVTQGMEESAVMGTLAGGVMGAGAGVVSGLGQKPPGVAEQEWQTILGAGDPDAIRPEVQPVEAPDLTTAPGAAEPRIGMDFTRDVDTSGLSLQDPAEIERARAQTMDFQRQDMTPDWETSQGAGVPREGLTMSPRQIDTSGLSLTPSEAMGIDPSAGPLSRAAASAVDSGATQAMQQAAAPQLEMNDRPDGTLMVAGDFNTIRAQLVESGIPAQSIIRNMRGATVGRTQAQAARQALSTQQEAANVSTPAPVQRTTDTGAGTGSAQPETGVPAGVGSSERGTGLASPGAELATGGDGSGRPVAAAAVAPTAVSRDSEWMAFAADTNTLGIPRSEMPQIKAEHRGAMVNFLKGRGVTSDQSEVDPRTLKPTQAEFSIKKVEKATGFDGPDRSILVSSDNHVVDGHHQWLAKLATGQPVKVIRLNAPIAELLPLVREFPSSTVDQATNVQNQPQGASGAQAKAAPVEARAPARGDAATAGAVSAKAGAGDVQADGVKRQENQQKADTSAEPVQKTAKTEQVAKAPAEPVKPEPAPQPKAEKPQDAQLDAATVDATDATYQPASQAHQKAATAFAERLSKNRDSFVLMDAVKPSGARAKEAQSVSDLANTMFGREVVFVKFKGRPLFNGAVSTTDPGKVFVNIESARPMMAVLGHELLHELRKSNPAAYNQLAKALKNVTKDDYIYAALLKQKYSDQGLNWTPQDISEELYGDIVGDNFMDPKFWEALAGDKPIFAKQLYRAVMNWLDKIASMFKRVKVRQDGRMVMTLAEQADGSRPFGTQKYLQDIESARAAVAQAMGQFKQGGKGKDALSVDDLKDQTKTEAFKKWFGDSKVVDSAGKPMVVYHGTASEFSVFNTGRGAIYFAADREVAQAYADSNEDGDGEPRVVEAYLRIEKPQVIDRAWADENMLDDDGVIDWTALDNISYDAEKNGHDGLILRGLPDFAGMDGDQRIEREYDQYIVFNSKQIKSATGNVGTFDPANPDIRFSIADAAGKGIDRIRQAANAAAGKNVPRAATMGDLDAEQKAFLSKTGSSKTPSTDVIKAATDRAGLKIRQGVIDRYAALKELDEKALGQDFIGNSITDSSWVLAKMSSAGSGALNAMMTTGRLEFDDKQKVIGIKGDANGGLTATLKKLGGPDEVERFFGWIAANRAEKLLGEGRENLFTPDEIKAAKRLNEGKTEEGKSRALLYTQAFKEFQEYRDDVLAIAEKSGIISDETRALWRDEFYVPFYRVMQDDGKTGGPGGGKGLSRQEAFKKLKGGSENLNDLMENTLMNFHHLLSASLKNQAASQAIRNAEKVGIANPVPESRRDTDKSTFVLKNGQKVYYEIDDPLVFESITSLSDPGLNNFAVRTMSAFKRVFTNLTTVTPQFVIANTFRDLLQASATSPTSKNVALNAVQGLKTYRDQKTRAEMLASGGAFSFGHIYGMDPDEVKASLRKTVKGADLISDPSMIPGILRKGWKHWNDAIDTSENISRAATYAQNVEGLGKLRAAFEARDVMDFSQHGAWPAVRLLVRVVPFLNARLQGLDKLYRSGVKPSILTAMGKGTDTDKQAAARFATVAGALAVATMALYMVNADDEEYQKLEEWQKDTYWFFRIGDNAFFLPKPFEVGAIATLAERTLQQFMDDKATGKLFGERVKEMLMQTFAFNPVPQMFQPIVDVYANRDAFTGRDIETMGMERLSPGLRARDTTTAVGRGLSAATRVFGDESAIAVSPVQADHLIKGYLGGVGASSAGILDTMYRAAMGQEAPDKRLSEYQPIRRFYRDLGAPAPNSRYSTLFYDGLREANRVYSDVMELQKLGKTEEAQELRTEKQNVLRMRQQLNAQQRRLSDINQRMQTVRRSDKDGEWKRREIDMLNTKKALITERMGKMIEIVRAE